MIKHCIKLQCISPEKTDLRSGCTCASMSCLTPGKFQNQEKVINTSQGDYLHCHETADSSGEVRWGERWRRRDKTRTSLSKQ